MSLLGEVAPSTMDVAGRPFGVRCPPASAARLVVRCTWLDRRRARHWSAQHVVALAFDAVTEREALSLLIAGRRPLVPLGVLRDAATWAVEQATGRSFGDVHGLSAWLCVHERRLAGRLLLAGVSVADRTLAEVLDMADAAVHDTAGPGDVRKWLDEAWASRDDFGESQSAQAGADAFMKLVAAGGDDNRMEG